MAILSIQNISKKFNIRHQTVAPYRTLGEELKTLLQRRSYKEEFYALKNISFNVAEGDSLGIIGKNGAGKSTLLKILSRITPPTEGKIICRGKIASLLEVGTGFHPELTGRENIFLNGSIMGMKKKVIQARFDEIVDFSGVEKFLDTPLKHYSSGMQLRLAFSVAAHLEPEIMVIDEVLAVGDAEFQKKCLGKMESVSRSGRTLLFVSHNLAALSSLCPKSILLVKGCLEAYDDTSSIIDTYMSLDSGVGHAGEKGVFNIGNRETGNSILKRVRIFNNQSPSRHLNTGRNATFHIECETSRLIDSPVIGIVIQDHFGTPVIGINNRHYGKRFTELKDKAVFIIQFEKLPLTPGFYKMDIYLGNGFTDFEKVIEAASFYVEATDFSGNGNLPNEKLNRIFTPDVKWELSAI